MKLVTIVLLLRAFMVTLFLAFAGWAMHDSHRGFAVVAVLVSAFIGVFGFDISSGRTKKEEDDDDDSDDLT